LANSFDKLPGCKELKFSRRETSTLAFNKIWGSKTANISKRQSLFSFSLYLVIASEQLSKSQPRKPEEGEPVLYILGKVYLRPTASAQLDTLSFPNILSPHFLFFLFF